MLSHAYRFVIGIVIFRHIFPGSLNQNCSKFNGSNKGIRHTTSIHNTDITLHHTLVLHGQYPFDWKMVLLSSLVQISAPKRERERERKKERKREREGKKEAKGVERDRETERDREKEKERKKERKRERESKSKSEKERERERETTVVSYLEIFKNLVEDVVVQVTWFQKSFRNIPETERRRA